MRISLRIIVLLVPLLAAAAGCNARAPASQADAHAMPDVPDTAARAPAPANTDKPDKSDMPAKPAKPTKDNAAPAKVVIDNFTFDPPVLTIAAGTEVVWVNRDDVPHTATSTTKPRAFDSGALDTDQTFSHVFTTAGEYEYFCAVHPHMTGRVVVK